VISIAKRFFRLVMVALLGFGVGPAAGAGSANLLRNADFQDDWITLLPENLTLHWSYSPAFTNRRDFNPDGWTSKGSWRWVDADALPGRRRFVVEAPAAEVRQRVNWAAVNDEHKLESFPDAGGFPSFAAVTSERPLTLVRDLLFRVRAQGSDVPDGAATIEVALAPPGKVTSGDPLGTVVPPTASASAPLPAGSYDWRWTEVRLSAAEWQRVAGAQATLPATASVAVRYKGAAGSVEIERAELTAAAPNSPNLLPHGGFEEVGAAGWPVGWRPAEKYTYFPPGLYYLFNSWHNDGFTNRGAPAVDGLVLHAGRRSLRVPALAGDEIAVASEPIKLAQTEPRLIEVSAWVKTDRVNQIQIDARDERGQRLDGFDFISKSSASIGTDEWRLVRQVFRPIVPVKSVSVMLCVRGVNGYTLGGAGEVPQNNVAGTVWWDDVRVYEPESNAAELAARGVQSATTDGPPAVVRLASLDLGERLLGENVLRATIANPGEARRLGLRWEFISPAGRVTKIDGALVDVPVRGERLVELPYALDDVPAPAYRENRGAVSVIDDRGGVVGSTEVAFSQWTRPIDLRLGGLYLRPEQPELVRLNLGLSHATLAKVRSVRLEIVRRATDETVQSLDLPATPAAIAAQRDRIPVGLRGDFSNLLLTDLDVSKLPLEPFVGPERRWKVRATVIGEDGKRIAVESAPFCRQAHDQPQPAVAAVQVKENLLYVNQKPWMPWGAAYGFAPAYPGPADPGPGAYRDLHNLPEWSMYDGFNDKPYNRRDNDFDSVRSVPSGAPDAKGREMLERRWKDDGLYASTYFLAPPEGAFSWDDLVATASGAEPFEACLRFAKDSPMVISTSPGFEESFGRFHGARPEQLGTLDTLVRSLRAKTGRPVMVGDGGAWNRFEFAKVPFFDIFDPETEPEFPANLHTDLWPLVAGADRMIWLRPQMYESVPYERWRFHTFVELMRGARGWQMAHGPSDETTFRGLHGELAALEPAVYSHDAGPSVDVDPPIEHWSRRAGGRTFVVAATTHAVPFGRWRWTDESSSAAGRARLSDSSLQFGRSENPVDEIVEQIQPGWVAHGIDSFPTARAWPSGTKLRQWVKIDPASPAKGVALVARSDSRWNAIASWGDTGLAVLRDDPSLDYWFLRRFYRNAVGFIGYKGEGMGRSLGYVPQAFRDAGGVPPVGEWTKLEVALDAVVGAGKSFDGVGFVQRRGRVFWGRTSIISPDGVETVLWGDGLGESPERLARVRIRVGGLPKGAKVRVLFEDRSVVAADGYFEDDFRGEDLYQRYGGADGYGDTPVALHVYEVP
jgi:hypothetical protein